MKRIAYLPGDGIGQEVLPAARAVLTAAGFEAEWVELPVGWEEWRRRGDPLPAATVDAMRTTQAALFGAIASKSEAEAQHDLDPHLRNRGLRYESPILRLRRLFRLHTNLRPVRSWPGVPNTLGSTNLVLFRENSEDLYAGIETPALTPELRQAWTHAGVAPDRFPPEGTEAALSVRLVTHQRTEALCREAFEYARSTGRHRVTLLEKANVLRVTGGLVRDLFYQVARDYPNLTADDLHIDAACARVVRDPQRFDVVVATNLFGDIFSDVAAEVAGGLGLAPSANLGPDYALFEPVHGSAPDIAGRGIANPVAAIWTGALLARHAGATSVADRVEAALGAYLASDTPKTPDLGGRATTADVTRHIVERVVPQPNRDVLYPTRR